jgi:hypothetical protein
MSTTEVTDELFESFLMAHATSEAWYEERQPASIYCRAAAHGEWLPTGAMSDPYDLLPSAVAFSAPDDHESMLMMYGWATRLPEGYDPDSDDDDAPDMERVRVRILVHMTNKAERLAIQFQGKTLEEQTDFGTGSFPETIRQLRELQKGRGL